MNIEKLIVGIDDNTDIDLLLQKGLRQFYFGYVPPKFIEKFGHSASLNRRNNIKEQFLNLEKLSNTIDKIHTKKGIVYLTLNPMVSNNTLLKYSKEVFELLKNSVDGIIVSTITLAVFLKNLGYKKIVVSNLFGNYSKDAVSFLIKQFKPIKIILPRDMRLEDIANIVNAFPSQEFECFLFGDGCRFSESFCFIDQGEYELSSQTLCSYATYNNKIVKKATPSFKMIVTDGSLDDNDKKELLSNEYIDVETLLDKLFIYYENFSSKDIAYNLQQLIMIDLDKFYQNFTIYSRAKFILKQLSDFDNADKLYQQLKNTPFKKQNSYNEYHNTNLYSLKKTLEFFEQYKNIKSYKVPSRGRNILNMIKLLENTTIDSYNYKQSTYKL